MIMKIFTILMLPRALLSHRGIIFRATRFIAPHKNGASSSPRLAEKCLSYENLIHEQTVSAPAMPQL